MEKLENISFDKQDQELFLIDDLPLKAKAIRNSILPKLGVVINYAISQIDKVYNTNVLDDCMIAQAPHYRQHQRVYDIKKDYREARASIRGQRKFGKWLGIKKKNGGEPQLPSLTLDLILNSDGIFIVLGNQGKFLSQDSYRKIFNFLSEYDSSINMIEKITRVFDSRVHTGKGWLVSHTEWLENKFSKQDFETTIHSDQVIYPIRYDQLGSIIDRLTLLYPIFHSYLQIAKGDAIQFDNLLTKAYSWWSKKEPVTQKSSSGIDIDLGVVKLKAETKIKIFPGIRWQVLQRDNWRCVACGRSADDGIILHVDHIIPRSKGGKDEIDNYQTLCHICNIGKSNKDETDLRKIKNAQ